MNKKEEDQMKKKTGIIDEPISEESFDLLDINLHADSLISFIKETETPITIGVQGEWGSGKTSLIQSIKSELDKDTIYKQIWINAWEYSLLTNPDESLIKIVNRIIQELLESDKKLSQHSKVGVVAKKVFAGALRIGAGAVGGDNAARAAKSLFDESGQNISSLRFQLNNLVDEIQNRNTNNFKKIIIYIDDLDRIEPKNAVILLELLKNIFNVRHCIFILAIDYQVVVKGLEHKFGKPTVDNEWEFRAFFDKIIQLPFVMPMSQYNIGKYVNKLLTDIGFTDGDGLDDHSITEIILTTIGGNPRSIKRLVNSISLIEIFSQTRNSLISSDKISSSVNTFDGQQKFLLFSLVCLQIAYPHIYQLLNQQPDFTKWNDKFAFFVTQKSEESKIEYPEFHTQFQHAQETEGFNESWEKSLYRICYIRTRLRNNSQNISRFLNYIKNDVLADYPEQIGERIMDALNQTSVTHITGVKQRKKN